MNIRIKQKEKGLHLSAETENGSYSQYYNTADKSNKLYVENETEAIQRFVRFYSKYEV